MRLVYLSLSWIIGTWLGSVAPLPQAVGVALLAGGSALAYASRRKRPLFLAMLCGIALGAGILRAQGNDPSTVDHALLLQNDRGSVEIRGMISDDPEPKLSTTAFRLDARERFIDGQWQKASGDVLVDAPTFPIGYPPSRPFPYYRYGDLIAIRGSLETPPKLEEFDYREYLARKGIYSILRQTDIVELIDSGKGARPLQWIYAARGMLAAELGRIIHEPEGSLAQAILLGKRGTLPDEIRDDFSRTGMSHIIAISGLHIGIVAGIILSFGVYVLGRRRPTYLLLATGSVWVYTILAGWQPSAIRAAIMVSLWLVAGWVGRPNSAINSLLLAAAVMAGINPDILGDVSFQLSFAAMAGLIFFTPRFQGWGRRIIGDTETAGARGKTVVVDSIAVTIGAILGTLPLVALYFHRISLVAVPATFLALPAVPCVIFTAAAAASVGLFAAEAAQILGWATWLSTAYIIRVADFLAALPFASLEIEATPWQVCAYYAGLAMALWLPGTAGRLTKGTSGVLHHLGSKLKASTQLPLKLAGPPLLISAALAWAAAFTAPDNRLHVSFLDVGQGDATLMQKGDRQILIDGGPDSRAIMTQLGARLPFWDRTIELVVLTHPDKDHLTGLLEVLRHYKVGMVLTSGQQHDSAVWQEWLQTIGQKNIQTINAEAGQRVTLGDGVELTVLHPQGGISKDYSADLNDNSVVLRLAWNSVSFLLAGDVSAAGEQTLLGQWPVIQSSVLKVSHHGSSTATSAKFLAAVGPEMAVISSGADNPFGHPGGDVISRLSGAVGSEGIWLTSEQGTIDMITDGTRLWVTAER